MSLLQRDLVPLAAILLALTGSYLAYDHLPAYIPVHWGIDGRIDGYSPKRFGVYLNPGVMAIVFIFFRLIPYADKNRVRQLREIGIYDPLRNGAVLLFGYAHLLVLGIGLRWTSPRANFLIGGISLLVLFAGDAIQTRKPARFDRLLRRLGIAPSDPARRRVHRSLSFSGICGLAGTFTGRAQILWLLLPLLFGLFHTRRRFPTQREPAP